MRRCPACGAELTRRPGEKRAYYLARTYCAAACYHADKPRRAEEARTELDLRDRAAERQRMDRLDFDDTEVLRRACQAAPRVPAATVAAIIAAVEPLIAATVRGRVLAPIALQVRANRTT